MAAGGVGRLHTRAGLVERRHTHSGSVCMQPCAWRQKSAVAFFLIYHKNVHQVKQNQAWRHTASAGGQVACREQRIWTLEWMEAHHACLTITYRARVLELLDVLAVEDAWQAPGDEAVGKACGQNAGVEWGGYQAAGWRAAGRRDKGFSKVPNAK